MTIAGLFLAFSKSPSLAMTIVVAMLVVCIFSLFLTKKVMPLFSKLQTLLDKINRTLREMLTVSGRSVLLTVPNLSRSAPINPLWTMHRALSASTRFSP